MPDDRSQTEQAQVERTKRLRELIEQLRRGQPPPKDSKPHKSLKEQIDERAGEHKEE